MKHTISFKKGIAVLLTVMALLFAACGNKGSGSAVDNDPPADDTTVTVSGVVLKQSTTIKVGAQETLTATVTPSNATNKNVTWESDYPVVAEVSQSGVVTARAIGTANITVTTVSGAKKAVCAVTVSTSDVPVTGVTVNKPSATIAAGGTETLFATVSPPNATNQVVSWNSANPAVAEVSQSGVVTAYQAGTTTITVTTNDGAKKAVCAVTVTSAAQTITRVTVSPASAAVAQGGTQQFSAIVEGTNTPAQNVTWTVLGSRGSGTTISADGLLTVSAYESAASLTVRATSTVDPTRSGDATVTVSAGVLFAPTNVTATAISSTEIKIEWYFVPGATGYRIYHSSSASGPYSLDRYFYLDEHANYVTNYRIITMDRLNPNTTHYYKVSAFNNEGEGPQSSPVSATTPSDQTTGDGFVYRDVSGGVRIIDYTGTAPNIKIPEQIDGKAVVSIGSHAFSEKPLNSVIIPNSVTNIGAAAFRYNRLLTSVTLPSSITAIEDWTFEGTQLEHIIIPASVTYIGTLAFANNRLKSVTLPHGLTYIGIGAFIDNQLKTIDIPNSVTTIGREAFRSNQLETINIPDRLTVINDNVFNHNKLTNVHIPSSVTSIGASAFSFNLLESVTIPDSVTSLGRGAFFDENNTLKSVTLGKNVALGDPDPFDHGFTAKYMFYGRQKGTYTRPIADGDNWTYSPQ